jgi:hypothetical protein
VSVPASAVNNENKLRVQIYSKLNSIYTLEF